MDNRGNLNIVIALLLVVVIAMGLGLSYLSSRPVDDVLPMESALPQEVATDSATVVSVVTPTYEPEQAFSTSVRKEMSARVVDPFLDYAVQVQGNGPVQGIIIRLSTEKNELYPYMMDVTYQSGKQQSVPIQKDTQGIAWWTPVCEQMCIFPDAFAGKYPEIMQRFSSQEP